MGKYSFPFLPKDRAKIIASPTHAKNQSDCLDIAATIDTPIRATRGGVVIFRESRFNRAYSNKRYMRRANFVIIKHADGEESWYGHLAWRSVCVAVGQKVRRGQIIALSGQTGYATYPHLHFGVYKNGKNLRVSFKTDE